METKTAPAVVSFLSPRPCPFPYVLDFYNNWQNHWPALRLIEEEEADLIADKCFQIIRVKIFALEFVQ